MATGGREKTKYAGVYFKIVKRHDGKGDERLYYIVYRRAGSRKQFEDKLGRASEGWTELKASIERGKRVEGNKQTNSEKREAAAKVKLTDGQPLTLDTLWQVYHNEHQSNRSIRDDVNRYARHIAPKLGSRLALELTTADISRLRLSLENTKLSPQSVKHCLALVKRIIRYSEKQGILAVPSPIQFEMPVVDNKKTENMTAEQLAAYWKALDEEPNQDAAAIMRLALLTGIRRGALFALKWSDIDFENAILTLRGESAKKGKTEHIPLNEAALAVLSRIEHTSSYVFPGKFGGERKTFQKISQRVRNKAGLPKDFRPLHGLRHVFASALASSGAVDLYTLQKLLTHGSPQMTQRYAHLADEAMRRAANVANCLAGKEDDKE